MSDHKLVKLKKDSTIKYGMETFSGSELLALVLRKKTGNTYKFSYTIPSTSKEEARFIHSRLNGATCIVGRFDKALVVDGEYIIPYGEYVALDPSFEYLYPLNPSELNSISDANVKIRDLLEILY